MELAIVFLLAIVIFSLLFYFGKRHLQKEFKAISYDLFQKNAASFLDMASRTLSQEQEKASMQLSNKEKAIDELIHPIKEALEKLQGETQELEKKREKVFVQLEEQIKALVRSEEMLSKETSSLSKALSSPTVRGTWGQIHLKRAIELAGLTEHCDFEEQKTIFTGERVQRPDLVINLPGKRTIVVDAKTPLDAYLGAVSADNESVQKEKLQQHAKALKKHVQELSGKEYFKAFPTMECVILFLPTDGIFGAALKEDPELLERALSKSIVLATPSTLFAILRAIAFTWRQDALSQNAQKIAEIGSELYERLQGMGNHFEKLGKSLQTSVDSYNQTLSSLDARVFVSARKLQKFMRKTAELEPPKAIEKRTKEIPFQ